MNSVDVDITRGLFRIVSFFCLNRVWQDALVMQMHSIRQQLVIVGARS